MVSFIILGVVAVIVIYFISAYNSFIHFKNSVEEAFATIDVYLKKRYDLLPNLVNTVKGYAKHESETLEKVISARNSCISSSSVNDKIANEAVLAQSLSKLFALSEAYPDLKANTNFLSLQNDIKGIENDLAQARKYYNGNVKIFNTKCDTFPSVLIAKVMNFSKFSYFEIQNEVEKENVKVEF